MKRISLLITFIVLNLVVNAQSFNEDKIAFSNFLKRMYTTAPFEGVKVVDDYESQYLISVISLDKAKYPSESIRNRIAQVKAQSQASSFLNGATISMDMVITSKEVKDSTNNFKTIVETVEQIKQKSVGFSQGLEVLTVFEHIDGIRMVFIYFRQLNIE
jgi:hypothetical protein